MNNDDIEMELRALTAALHRPDPTPAWKAAILARARLEAGATDAIPMKRTLPPRLLAFSWAAAWAAIIAMNLTAPKDASAPAPGGFASTRAPSAGVGEPPPSLLAFQRNMTPNLDQP